MPPPPFAVRPRHGSLPPPSFAGYAHLTLVTAASTPKTPSSVRRRFRNLLFPHWAFLLLPSANKCAPNGVSFPPPTAFRHLFSSPSRMESSQVSSFDSQSEQIYITFKFGGGWITVKNQDRRKYDRGKQRSIKIVKNIICLALLREKVENICPWLRGHNFELHCHIYGTSPKEYKALTSDLDVTEILIVSDRAEVVVIHKEIALDCINSTGSLSINQSRNSQSEDTNRLVVGAIFEDSKAFKAALQSEAIINNFGVIIKKSDRKRVIATCAHRGCEWRIRASVCEDGLSFEVKKIVGAHMCPGINRAGNRQATTSWIANTIQDLVKRHPDIPPKQINSNFETSYGLSLPYMKIWRGREYARELIFGSVEDNFKWVPTLRAELIKGNPGSHIAYTIEGDCASFQRFFVSFKVCMDGFLAGCRHLIGLDACHLKSKYLGVLLSATTLDGNSGLYILAFAVVETESKKTWHWFLENLAEALYFVVYPLAFISDMEKVLAEAIRLVFPDAEHRVCIRHLWKNLKKLFHFQESQRIQSLVWTAANAYTELTFHTKLQEIYNLSPTIHSYLISLPYNWSRSQFTIIIKNDSNTNNTAESFNAWISEARSKHAVDLVDIIRSMLMEQRATRKMISAGWRGELVPYAEEYLREITTRTDQFIVRPVTMCIAEVEDRTERHEVDVDLKECSCRLWQMIGLPCIHAIAYIGTKEHPLWHIYVDESYYVSRYKMAYEGPIAALLDKAQWIVVDDGVQVTAPSTSRPRGRPKKKRMRSFLEKDPKSHKCSRCSQWGHHRSTCKNPISQEQGTSQGASSSRPKLPIRREAVNEATSNDELVVDDIHF